MKVVRQMIGDVDMDATDAASLMLCQQTLREMEARANKMVKRGKVTEVEAWFSMLGACSGMIGAILTICPEDDVRTAMVDNICQTLREHNATIGVAEGNA